MSIKSFSITRNKFKKPEDKTPDYKMSVKIDEEFVECAGLWLKDAKDGSKFFSGKMSNGWVDHTKGRSRKGFSIVADGETETVKNYKPEEGEAGPGEIPF